jgi:hypothetical protein
MGGAMTAGAKVPGAFRTVQSAQHNADVSTGSNSIRAPYGQEPARKETITPFPGTVGGERVADSAASAASVSPTIPNADERLPALLAAIEADPENPALQAALDAALSPEGQAVAAVQTPDFSTPVVSEQRGVRWIEGTPENPPRPEVAQEGGVSGGNIAADRNASSVDAGEQPTGDVAGVVQAGNPKPVAEMKADEIRSELSSLNQPTGGSLPVIRKRLEKARNTLSEKDLRIGTSSTGDAARVRETPSDDLGKARVGEGVLSDGSSPNPTPEPRQAWEMTRSEFLDWSRTEDFRKRRSEAEQAEKSATDEVLRLEREIGVPSDSPLGLVGSSEGVSAKAFGIAQLADAARQQQAFDAALAKMPPEFRAKYDQAVKRSELAHARTRSFEDLNTAKEMAAENPELAKVLKPEPEPSRAVPTKTTRTENTNALRKVEGQGRQGLLTEKGAADAAPDYSSMTIAQLRDEAKARGVDHRGSRAAVVKRLSDTAQQEPIQSPRRTSVPSDALSTPDATSAPKIQERTQAEAGSSSPNSTPREPWQMTKAERDAEIARLRADPVMHTPLITEGAISPTQINRMGERAKAKWQESGQQKMRNQSRIRELSMSDAELAADRACDAYQRAGAENAGKEELDRLDHLQNEACEVSRSHKFHHRVPALSWRRSR